jgi:hypothetical protein
MSKRAEKMAKHLHSLNSLYSLYMQIFVDVDFFLLIWPFVLFKKLLQIHKKLSQT